MKQRHIAANYFWQHVFIEYFTSCFFKFFQYTCINISIKSFLAAKSTWPLVIEFSFISDTIVFMISYVYLKFCYCCWFVYVVSFGQVQILNFKHEIQHVTVDWKDFLLGIYKGKRQQIGKTQRMYNYIACDASIT